MSHHDDIREQVQDHVRITEHLTLTRKLHISFLAHCASQKIPPTKVAELKKWLEDIYQQLTSMTSFGSLISTQKSLIDARQKTLKKIRLKKTDLDYVQMSINHMQQEMKVSALELDNLVSHVLLAPTKSDHIAQDITAWRKNIHQYNDELITAKFDLVTQTQKLTYLILELDKQHQKAITKNNSLITTKIQDITTSKIPHLQSKIDDLSSQISSIETSKSQENTLIQSKIDERLQYVQEWKITNKDSTKLYVAEQKKSLTNSGKSIAKDQKTYAKLLQDGVKNMDKLVLTPAKLQTHLQKEVQLYNKLSAEYIQHLAYEFLVYLTQVKDIHLDRINIQQNITHTSDRVDIHKELSMQTALIHRIHPKQSAAHLKLTKKLKEVTKKHKLKMKSLETRTTKLATHISSASKTYTKQKATHKKAIDSLKQKISNQKKLLSPLEKKSELLTTQAHKNTKHHMIKLLSPEQKLTLDHINALQTVVESLKSSNVKLDIQIQETLKSAALLHDKKRKDEAIKYEKQLHAQQVSLDTLENHLDLEVSHLEILTSSIQDYTKDIAQLDKKIVRLKKKK